MIRQSVTQALQWPNRSICLFCAARASTPRFQQRSLHATAPLLKRKKGNRKASPKPKDGESATATVSEAPANLPEMSGSGGSEKVVDAQGEVAEASQDPVVKKKSKKQTPKESSVDVRKKEEKSLDNGKKKKKEKSPDDRKNRPPEATMSLKDALLSSKGFDTAPNRKRNKMAEQLNIQDMHPADLAFEAVKVDKPPVPMLSYGLDRVLFNPGVYLLQDPRSRIYNFDPYLEKVMPVNEFNFDALSEYKTSSKDQDLLNLTRKLETKFTGSTSSMSGVLQHFHYLLSGFRPLNHNMLSRDFPDPSKNFSKISHRPNAIFLRYKDGLYAIDADKSFDTPNIMSWLGHSLEKLLTVDRSEFELYRRSNNEKAPAEDDSSRCFHYSKLGNFLMRSQLDAYDPRLPGSGVFDLKTRAVVSIRMNHQEYEAGSGYQLRFAQGQWESYEREFYDMTRATMLKYSLQVRMGRMDGIFVAYHNIERIFGFQYLPLGELDKVLHGQEDTTLGDQEFKLSVGLLDELLSKATAQFPETSIRLHFETRNGKPPFMYVFAEPVTEEQADEIQGAGDEAQKHFARTVVGLQKDDAEIQEAWQNIQESVDEQVDQDGNSKLKANSEEKDEPVKEQDDSLADSEATNEVESKQDAVESTEEEQNSTETAGEGQDSAENVKEGHDEVDNRPLIGWTLTVRSKVNNHWVDRPSRLDESDDWRIQYHIQEISDKRRWQLYEALKERRRGLSDMEGKEVDKGLSSYRQLIQRYSNRGREWRKEQDKINEEMGVQLYRPLGPGSDAQVFQKMKDESN